MIMKPLLSLRLPRKDFRTKCGFTLIELLVVIAIIAILAGMLLPALARARQKGQVTACINNLHQMTVATRLYADDFGGRYPFTFQVRGDNVSQNRARKNPAAGLSTIRLKTRRALDA